LIPRIIAVDEWAHMDAGLRQRIEALEAFLADVYGDGRCMSERIIPREIVEKSSGYLPAVKGIVPPGGVRVHVAGIDIIHQHPNCDGAALGKASYRDFLIYARTVENLEGGVMLSFGSAIMGPEVYLKALAMARNVARQEGRSICHFTTAVFDLVPIGGDYHKELPKTDPGYYFRPHKTILVRTVADGGESYYICGDHRLAIPGLRQAIVDGGKREVDLAG
jgi:hypothetical protein